MNKIKLIKYAPPRFDPGISAASFSQLEHRLRTPLPQRFQALWQAVWLNAHPEALQRHGVPVVAGQTVKADS